MGHAPLEFWGALSIRKRKEVRSDARCSCARGRELRERVAPLQAQGREVRDPDRAAQASALREALGEAQAQSDSGSKEDHAEAAGGATPGSGLKPTDFERNSKREEPRGASSRFVFWPSSVGPCRGLFHAQGEAGERQEGGQRGQRRRPFPLLLLPLLLALRLQRLELALLELTVDGGHLAGLQGLQACAGLVELAGEDFGVVELRLRGPAVGAVDLGHLLAQLLLAGEPAALAGGDQGGAEAFQRTVKRVEPLAQLVALGQLLGPLPGR